MPCATKSWNSIEWIRHTDEPIGYESLIDTYGVSLLDLNHDEPVPVDVYDWRLHSLHLARSILDSGFRILVGPPKTHDIVIVTLSLKN